MDNLNSIGGNPVITLVLSNILFYLILREQEMNKGGKAEQHLYRSHDDTGKTPTLAEVGITYSMSSRAQKIASVPKAEFEAVIIVS